MQCMNEALELQQKPLNETFGSSIQEQLNQQTQTQGFNFYKSNIQVNKSDNFIGQKQFRTNQTLNNQAPFTKQGIAIGFNNQFQIKQSQIEIEQSRKEKESRIQDLMNIAEKAVQRRKEKVVDKYLQPNQYIIEDQL